MQTNSPPRSVARVRRLADDTLLVRHLPLAATAARRYTKRQHIDEQLFEAALVGLVRAVDTFDPLDAHEFGDYAEGLVDDELRRFIDDCRLERQDRMLLRDQAAAAAIRRVERALFKHEDVRVLAAGFRTADLASGLVSLIARHPEFLSPA